MADSVSEEILRGNFKQIAELLLHILTENESTGNTSLNRHCLSILATCLIKQETTRGFWSSPLAVKCVNALLAFIDSTSLKTQRTVHSKLTSLLKHHKSRSLNSVITYVGDFCVHVIQECTRSDYKRTYAVLQFLARGAVYLFTPQLVAVMQNALNLPNCAQPVLTAATCSCLDSILQSSDCDIPAETLNAFVFSLLELQLNTADAESIVNYSSALVSAIIALKTVDENAATYVSLCVCVIILLLILSLCAGRVYRKLALFSSGIVNPISPRCTWL